MTHPNQHALQRLSETVAAKMGLHFTENRQAELVRGLRAAAPLFGFSDPSACAKWLIATPLTREHIEILASCLTVGETYFFRDGRTLAALREAILPELIAAHRATDRRLRLWSAGCSTGEEAYSLAMLLDELVPDLADWDVLILASDINPRFLHAARQGRYRPWSFRECPPALLEKYFRHAGPDQFEILPGLRRRVTFTYLNLAEDPFPALLNNTNAMDLILCRNVLMYFGPETARRITVKLAHCLVEGGRLIVSPCEAWTAKAAELEAERYPGASVLRRRPAPAVPGPAAGTPPRRRRRPAQAIPPDTTSAETTYRRAAACFAQGLYRETIDLLTSGDKELRNHSRGKERKRTMTLLARSYANLGILSRAETWCHRALTVDRCDAALHYLLATILQEEGRLDDARHAFRTTLHLDPTFALAHFALGTLAQQQTASRAAHRHFNLAVDLLENQDPRTVVPFSEGIPAGRLLEIIHQQESGM